MPNDDLGQFPSPTSSTPPLSNQPAPDPTSILNDINAPVTNQTSTEDFTTPPTTNSSPIQEPITNNQELVTAAPTFEETPDEIPSVVISSTTPSPELTLNVIARSDSDAAIPAGESGPALNINPQPATFPTPKGGSSFGSLIGLILLLISGVALAVTVFLFSQSQQLKKQLGEVTQTLEQQRTTITPSPTPTIIEFVTPTPESTESGLLILPTATPSATPTATISANLTSVLPLADAANALKVAINHLPNAQLLIIKTENATTPKIATSKYFFRQDLTTKKYFYVLISGSSAPEIADKAIYVTPDNNIPSLNDFITGDKLGVDLDEALRIANAVCTSKLCETATIKAQYIKSGANLIWQLSFDPIDANKNTLILQLNATTKEVIYKSPGF